MKSELSHMLTDVTVAESTETSCFYTPPPPNKNILFHEDIYKYLAASGCISIKI